MINLNFQTYQPRADWTVEYPAGIIKYNDMFRHKLLDYKGVVRHLIPMFKERGIVKIVDFGCGTGTLLFEFEEQGLTCFGFDRHEESVVIAKAIAQRRGSHVSFAVGDMLSAAKCGQFDAAVQTFVPISFQSQSVTLKSMCHAVRPGGLYAFMVIEAQPSCLENDERMIVDVVESDTCKVARIEPWKKRGNFIMWEPVLIVQDAGKFAMYVDHDELELYTPDTFQRLMDVVDDVGFRVVDILTPVGPLSPPPWTTEKMITVELIRA